MGDGLDLLKRGPEYVINLNCVRFMVWGPIILVMLFLMNLFRPPPYCTLEKFYFPALDKTSNSSTDTSFTFNVKLKNLNHVARIYYEDINITFYDNPDKSHQLANFTIPKFRQGVKREAVKGGTLNTTGFNQEAHMKDISDNGFVVFRVELATSWRSKFMWFSKTYGLRVGANVKVGDGGNKVNHKRSTYLKSSASKKTNLLGGIYKVLMFNLLVIGFLICWV